MVGQHDDRRYGADHDDWDGSADERLETEQLELTGDEERLPWLESAEDDDEAEQTDGYDTGKMLGLFVIALAVLGAVVGGIWWASNRNSDPALVADGSVVPAPSQPYKTAPTNPGGKTFDGTGDSSFAVSEGQNRPAQLGGPAAPPIAAREVPVAAPAKAGPAAPAAAPAVTGGGVGVQVGAFSSQAKAQEGWTKLVAQASGVLSGVSHRVVAGTADNGTIYRLQAIAPDAASANALCGRLKAAGVPCQVK